MKSRTRNILIGFTAVIVVAVLLGYLHFQDARKPVEKTDADAEGVATITIGQIKSGQVSQSATVYGTVMAQPGAVTVLSASVECRVRHLKVTTGQSVENGAAVIEIEPSPDVRVQLIDATNALDGAKKDAANVHQRLDLKLATAADAQTADQAMRSAQIKLDDLTNRGAGEEHQSISASAASVVAKVDVQEGQLVAAGMAMVELVPRGQIEVRLGVEDADALLVHSGQAVQLFPNSVDDDEPIEGTVRLVTRMVNPDSRRVDVFVTPAETDALLLDGAVRAELALKTVSGLVVPHDALLPDDAGFSIFTVVDNHAVKHSVKVAVQNDKEAVIIGDGLHEGDTLVVAGNLELDDKASVETKQATTSPAEAEGEK